MSHGKPTMATLKAFIRKNRANLYLREITGFDPITDCAQSVSRRGFHPIETSAQNHAANLGISGVWVVGRSRDYIEAIDTDGFRGFHVYNSCGSFDLAIPAKEALIEYFTDAFGPNVMALARL